MASARTDVENIYPLTPMQQGMLFHALLEPRSQAYFEQLSWRVRGELDVVAFEAAWNALIERHASLRSMFVHEGTDTPLQVVLRSRPIAVARLDLRCVDAERGVHAYKDADRARPFLLGREPLLRVAVLRLAEDGFEIVWSHHHIALDGWSVGLVIAELLDLYRGLRAGQPAALPTAAPFARFVKWLQGRDQEAAARFWAKRLGRYAERVTIPHTRTGAVPAAEQRGTLSFSLGTACTARLQELAARRGATLAVVLHAIWALLLGRYADTNDVVFGSVVSGRPPEVPDVERIVGNFINTIPVRVHLDRAATFDELVDTMQREAGEAGPHQHAALARVQSAHRLEEGLFGTLVSLANYPVDPRLTGEAGLPDLGFAVEAVTHLEQTHYDLDVQFVPAADLQVRITYAAGRYEPAQVAAIEGHFLAVAEEVTRRAGIRLDQIDILSASERAAIRGTAAPEAAPGPTDTLVDAFERCAARVPDRIAVVAAGESLTYAELDRRANALAHRLRALVPIEPDAVVAVLAGRGTELAVALLAVLKAGAAYLPLEPSLPRERIAYIVADARCLAVIASGAAVAGARAAVAVPVLDARDPDARLELAVGALVRPADLAYVIYTSGSTGRPKGVMIEHHSVVNLVRGLEAHVYERYPGALRVALLASYGFDASVQQIFAALLLGHTLVVVDEATRRDGAALNRFLRESRVDVIDATPTLLGMMARSEGFDAVCGSVRHALVGGEPLPWDLADQVVRPGGMAVSNVYGPTECCVDATAHLVNRLPGERAGSVPVGAALPNVAVFVVDRAGHLAPRGARGEICIAGRGVGRGYVNDEALTATRFVRLPALGGLRAFRTADAGRVLTDGSIECLGRYDDQVKVRGYRIETGEIEHHLATHPGVEQVAVFVAKGEEGGELHAALVLSTPVTVEALRAHLGEMLPEHMIPSRFLRMDALPRTDSGKLDRKQLATQAAGQALEVGADYAAPSGEIEHALAATWQAVLGTPRVGVDDSYFSLGGDSIKAIQILSRLARQGLRMEIRDLFHHRTIRSLAPFITRAGPAAGAPPRPAAPQLTAAQARFFAEHLVEPGRFHHAVLLDARGRLDAGGVARAFAAVRDRHEGLRLAFDREPRALPAGAPHPYVETVTDLPAALPGLLAPFDLAAGNLHRLAIARGAERDRLLVVVHHLCIDGVSWRILIEDLAAALHAAEGPAAEFMADTDTPFAVAAAVAEYGRAGATRAQLAYWREVESRCSPLVDAGDIPPARHRDRATITLTLDESGTAELLTHANRAYGTSAEDLLLAAFARALHARFGVTATGLTLESHGRHPLPPGVDASRTIGWFTSLYPFVLAVDPGRDLGHQVKSVKEALRAVPDRGLAYGVLRYLGGAPLGARPQVSFNYLGQMDADPGAPLAMSPQAVEGGVHPDAACLAELEVSALALAGYMRLALAFNAARFDIAAMRELLEAWRREIAVVVAFCAGRPQGELTPSDLSYARLSVDDLENLFK